MTELPILPLVDPFGSQHISGIPGLSYSTPPSLSRKLRVRASRFALYTFRALGGSTFAACRENGILCHDGYHPRPR
jgi:hypothetical protein